VDGRAGVAFRPDEILKVLEHHRVRYVVIGGLAAALYGSGTVTFDIDIVPDSTPENLTCLASALDELDARIRVDGIDGGLPFAYDARTLGSMEMINLVTRHGDFDITFHPSGVSSFSEWDAHAKDTEALGVHFRLASLADVIRSKETAGRTKDLIAVPILRELLKRQRDG
jgi:hypothetical protein